MGRKNTPLVQASGFPAECILQDTKDDNVEEEEEESAHLASVGLPDV